MPGLLWPIVIYAVVLLLHLAVPGRWVDGYVRDAAGRPLRYRLNGLRVFVVTVALYVGACRLSWIAPDVFYVHRWAMAAGACALGLAFTFAIVLPARPRGSLIADLYLGRIDNPRWAGVRRPRVGDDPSGACGRLTVDAKMFLYLVGAIMLELNVLSFAAHHLALHPADPSPGVLLHVVMFTFFVAEYLNFEEVHLYTYDFFAERVGFKLGWGCLVFYPFFYAVGLWDVAERANPHTPPLALAGCLVLFFVGWALSRGANLQKFLFKTRPSEKLFGLLAPATVDGGGKQLLCSGFWRLSRHINYLGEILMAVALALVLGYPLAIGPWLYPLYYVALLLPRQHDDDKRCAAKYGALWTEYCHKVPYRIVPWVY